MEGDEGGVPRCQQYLSSKDKGPHNLICKASDLQQLHLLGNQMRIQPLPSECELGLLVQVQPSHSNQPNGSRQSAQSRLGITLKSNHSDLSEEGH